MATEVKLFGKWTYDDVKTKEEISLCVRPLFESQPRFSLDRQQELKENDHSRVRIVRQLDEDDKATIKLLAISNREIRNIIPWSPY